MEMNCQDTEASSCQGRSLRKRPSKPIIPAKRRKSGSSMKDFTTDNVEDIYRQDSNKLIDFHPTALETIYESPRKSASCLRDIMGAVKLRRHCKFSQFSEPSKYKITQRKKRAKCLKRLRGAVKKVTLEEVEKVLQNIAEECNDDNIIDNANTSDSHWCYRNNIIIPDTSFSEITNITSNMATMTVDKMDCEALMVDDILKNNCCKDLEESIDFTNSPFFPPPKSSNKRSRRRSGRVSHAVSSQDISEIPDVPMAKDSLQNLHQQIEVIISESNDRMNNSFHMPLSQSNDLGSSQVQLPGENSIDTNLLNEKTKGLKVIKNQKRKSERRVSGTHKSLYSQTSIEPADNQNKDALSHAKLSGCISSLANFDKLSISPQNNFAPNKKRRSARLNSKNMKALSVSTDSSRSEAKSANSDGSSLSSIQKINVDVQRLSVGQHLQNNCNILDSSDNLENYVESCRQKDTIASSVMKNSSTVNSVCTEYDSLRCNKHLNLSYYQQPISVLDADSETDTDFNTPLPKSSPSLASSVEMPTAFDILDHDNSPVISGIFDSKVRIIKGKKIVLGEHNLKYFNISKYK